MSRLLTLSPRTLLVLGGVLLTCGFAPLDIWPLAVAGLVLLLRVVAAAPTRKAAVGRALVFGVAHGATALYWLPWAFWRDSDSLAFAVLGGVPATLGLALWIALGYGLAAGLAWGVRGRFWLYTLVFAAALLAVEVLRGLTPYGFPWLPLGMIWVGTAPNPPLLAQLASVGGVPLLSTLVLGFASLVATLRPKAWLLAATLLGAMGAYGAWRTAVPVPLTGPLTRVVQPNLGSSHKWDATLRWAFLDETLWVATAPMPAAYGRVAPELLVLPETGLPFVLAETPAVGQALRGAFPSATTVLTGSIRTQASALGEPQYFNSLQAVQNGVVQATADKQLLVPFGEFLPLRAVLDALPMPTPLRVLSQSRLDFTHGQGSARVATPAGDMVALICYEGIFPYFVARHAHGARALVNITNDAWFTGTSALYQHAALQRVRAIETGLPLLRSANTGISLVVDGQGRILRKLEPNQAGVLDILLPQALSPTVWLRTLR